MAKLSTDYVGDLAERLADIALFLPVGKPFNRPLFRLVALGKKYPTADFLVDALDSNDTVLGYFFIQVKGTAQASPTAPRITIDVERDQFNRLVRLPIPAYVIAVDIQTEQSYLIAACRTRRTAVSSVTKAFPLSDDAVKIALYREVTAFWSQHLSTRRTSNFHDA
jgi:hypothetical protein